MPKDEQVLCLKRIDLEPVFGGSLPQGGCRWGSAAISTPTTQSMGS